MFTNVTYYVMGRNEYVITTLSESTIPQVYSLQFFFKSTYHSWRYKRKCEWVFFLNTVYMRYGFFVRHVHLRSLVELKRVQLVE